MKTGRAAHICGAAPLGPRYEASQTKEQRTSFANGIWLCAECADLIDKDNAQFPAPVLHDWKRQHDAWLRAGDYVPGLPQLTITTQTGLYAMGTDLQVVTADLINRFRDHAVVVRTTSRHQLRDLRLRFQLHEGLSAYRFLEKGTGEVSIRAEGGEWVASVQGAGASVTLPPPPPPTSFVMEIERLMPDRPLRCVLRTVDDHFRGECADDEDPRFAGQLVYHVTGNFLYELNTELSTRTFIIPLHRNGRSLTAAASAENISHPPVWTVRMM